MAYFSSASLNRASMVNDGEGGFVGFLSMLRTVLHFATCNHHFYCVSIGKSLQWFCTNYTERLHQCYIHYKKKGT
jgi:hypothetical protein